MVTDSRGNLENSQRTRKFAVTSLLAAVIMLLTFTPLGFINLGFINATTNHIPVIIGSLTLGPRLGAFLGGVFGMASLLRSTMSPTLLSFAFSPFVPVPGSSGGSAWALVVCFVPRILIGVAPHYVDKALSWALRGREGGRALSLFWAGFAGAATNTILVMGLMYMVFKDAFAAARNMDPGAVYAAVVSIVFTVGVPEAVVAGVAAMAVCRAAGRYFKK